MMKRYAGTRWEMIMSVDTWIQERRAAKHLRILGSSVDDEKTTASPSGQYRLMTAIHRHPDDAWAYSSGRAFALLGTAFATIERNYGAFPFLWVEDHPNGHDYLICGEDYQGQTVIELDTGKRVDHLPDEAKAGHGFCWAQHFISPDRRVLAVEGCYWACPYEVAIFDFGNPLVLPYPKLHQARCDKIHHGFQPDGTITWQSDDEVRKSDGALLDDLDDASVKALLDAAGRFRQDLLASVTTTSTWRPDGSVKSERQYSD
jgi:hypothetical protein